MDICSAKDEILYYRNTEVTMRDEQEIFVHSSSKQLKVVELENKAKFNNWEDVVAKKSYWTWFVLLVSNEIDRKSVV